MRHFAEDYFPSDDVSMDEVFVHDVEGRQISGPFVHDVTPQQISDMEIFGDESNMFRDVVGLAGVGFGALSLFDGFKGGLDADKVSIGLLSTGGGLAMMGNETLSFEQGPNLRMLGRGLLMAGIIYEGASRLGLIRRLLGRG
jgi:hypothetical protein